MRDIRLQQSREAAQTVPNPDQVMSSSNEMDSMSPVRRALQPEPVVVEESSRWVYYHKPIIIMVIGGLLFTAGTVIAFLYFSRVGRVPYALGPVCLSIGLMFLVTGLVWVPVIRQKVRKGLIREMYSRRLPI